jgi:TRAP-type mannitol/chloroaromatic compound transport system substrate-binding protein
VPAFEVLDATHKKVLDGAHSIAYYWVGKHKAAVLFTGGPGGPYWPEKKPVAKSK